MQPISQTRNNVAVSSSDTDKSCMSTTAIASARMSRSTALLLHTPYRSMLTTHRSTNDEQVSEITVSDGIVYIYGQIDATAMDIAGQTINVLSKIDKLLSLAGTSKSNMLTATIRLKDLDRDYREMNNVWNKWIDWGSKPVRATIEANMIHEKALVEIQLTAARDGIFDC